LLRPAATNDTSGKHLFRNVAANCRLRPNANKHSSTVRRPEIFCQESTESNDVGTHGRGSGSGWSSGSLGGSVSERWYRAGISVTF
jgi:hypothetical protein